MDLELYSSVVATIACILILAEWSYVYWWTRSVAKNIVGGVLRQVGGLRTGRGTAPTVPETFASIADANGQPALPPVGAQGIPDELIEAAAQRFGITKEQARAYAQQFLSNEGGAAGAGGVDPRVLGIGQKFLEGKKLTPAEMSLGVGSLLQLLKSGNAQQGGGSAAPPAASGGGWL